MLWEPCLGVEGNQRERKIIKQLSWKSKWDVTNAWNRKIVGGMIKIGYMQDLVQK